MFELPTQIFGRKILDGVGQGRQDQSKYYVGAAYALPTKTQIILNWDAIPALITVSKPAIRWVFA